MTTDTIQEVPRTIMSRSARRIAEAEQELQDLMEAETQGAVEPEQSAPEQVEAQQVEVEENDLSSEEKSFKKRYGDLRRFQQQKEKEWQDKFNELERKLTEKSSNLSLPKTEAEVAQWVKKYPDVAAIVESLADKKARERDVDLDLRLKNIEEMRDSLASEKAETELMKLHPDFDEIRETDAFHDWAEEQPRWVQSALYEDTDVKAAARAIDLYKLDKGIKKTTPEKNAALSVNTRNRVAPKDDTSSGWYSESQVAKMSDKEYAAKAEEIDKAQREGKFRYDLSQKSR
jgi:hypothetical protein